MTLNSSFFPNAETVVWLPCLALKTHFASCFHSGSARMVTNTLPTVMKSQGTLLRERMKFPGEK